MSERSEALRRRRDLLREELRRIENDLAAEESATPDAFAEPGTLPGSEAEEILSRFREAPSVVAGRAKTGCMILSAGLILALLSLVVLGYLVYSRQPHGH